LMTRVRRHKARVTVPSIQAFVTKEPIARAVNIIGSALRDRIYNATHGLSKFGGVVIRDHLKLLHRFLRDRAANSRTSGILVVVSVGRVISISQESVMPGNTAEAEQTESAVWNNSRRHENERVDSAA